MYNIILSGINQSSDTDNTSYPLPAEEPPEHEPIFVTLKPTMCTRLGLSKYHYYVSSM